VKRLFTLVVISTLLFNSQALAATRKPTVKPLKLITTVSNIDEFAGLVTSGPIIVVYGNRGDKSFAKALDIMGNELWNIPLDSASPSVATAATVDIAGTIWIAGSTSLKRARTTPSPSATTLNPDNITSIPDIFTTDLDAFTLWSLIPSTQALTQYSLQLSSPILINAIAVTKDGLTAVGSSGAVINSDLSGKISKPVFIGSGATDLEAVIKASDGSMTVVGSSSETLSGKKLVGKVDGVIIKLSKIGKVTSVIRSSAPKALRSWNSASTSLLLGGEVVTGNKIESAVTKFSNSYVPTWTYRILSTGKTFTSGSTYAFLQSKGPLTQLANWSPKSPSPLLLTFDAKGGITGGYSAPVEQKEVLGLYFSKDLGILCISASTDTVSIFTLN
jgi:hypothetical protein